MANSNKCVCVCVSADGSNDEQTDRRTSHSGRPRPPGEPVPWPDIDHHIKKMCNHFHFSFRLVQIGGKFVRKLAVAKPRETPLLLLVLTTTDDIIT